ncbi:hypothetical protein [Chitinophaga pinensis]|uniref:Uncharacterized protein n=1 Tax=Chitinophaga pinensis TaxID=79329 RepID=A0A5C6LWP4_9BACT|nr:hypothetical protein [Chitinophaga pinensis]TWW00099.1 hypothetical protein FEF09_12165 [Chitinophaga pinensis]
MPQLHIASLMLVLKDDVFRTFSEKPITVTGEITHSYDSYLDTLQAAAHFLSSHRNCGSL